MSRVLADELVVVEDPDTPGRKAVLPGETGEIADGILLLAALAQSPSGQDLAGG